MSVKRRKRRALRVPVDEVPRRSAVSDLPPAMDPLPEEPTLQTEIETVQAKGPKRRDTIVQRPEHLPEPESTGMSVEVDLDDLPDDDDAPSGVSVEIDLDAEASTERGDSTEVIAVDSAPEPAAAEPELAAPELAAPEHAAPEPAAPEPETAPEPEPKVEVAPEVAPAPAPSEARVEVAAPPVQPEPSEEDRPASVLPPPSEAVFAKPVDTVPEPTTSPDELEPPSAPEAVSQALEEVAVKTGPTVVIRGTVRVSSIPPPMAGEFAEADALPPPPEVPAEATEPGGVEAPADPPPDLVGDATVPGIDINELEKADTNPPPSGPGPSVRASDVPAEPVAVDAESVPEPVPEPTAEAIPEPESTERALSEPTVELDDLEALEDELLEDDDEELEEADLIEEDEVPAQVPGPTSKPPAPPKKEPQAAPPQAPPQAPQNAPAAAQAPPSGAQPLGQKRRKPWFETFFSDDYLRTVRPPTPKVVARECDFMESALGLAKGATILDVGCGLGLHAIELTQRGYLVVGLDLSLPMLSRAGDEAQDLGLKINFLHADMREVNFDGAFDAVICWGTTFGYFDDESNLQVIKKLHRALKPKGLLLLDVVNRDHVIRQQPNLIWFEGDDCVCMEESKFNYFTSRLHVKRTVILDDGRQRETVYGVRLYPLHELGQLLHHQDFRVTQVSGMMATPGVFFGGDSPRMIILAERRAAPKKADKPSDASKPPPPPAEE